MASLMQELIATLRKEQEAYQELLPVVEQKTQAIIANDLQKVQTIFLKVLRANWKMSRILRTYFRGEEVPRMALRVLRPKSPHSEDVAQYIEWRDPCGHAAVWL